MAMEKSSMSYFKIFIIISFLMFSANAGAEFYKYVDDEGHVRFTDDINEVPEAQRANIRSYIESENEETSEPEVSPENETDQQSNFPDLSDTEQESLDDAKKRIDQLKKEIDQEYEALLKEKEQLIKEKEQAKTREQISEYNKKVESMNKRVEAYMEKGKTYKTAVDDFNARIAGQNSENQTP
jgi:flagellar motility protein MotE (MotC chaperone)